MGKLIGNVMDFSMANVKDRLDLDGAMGTSVRHDLKKLALEAEQDLKAEMEEAQNLALEQNPALREQKEQLKRVTSAMTQLPIRGTRTDITSDECEWEKDALMHIFNSLIGNHPEWIRLKERALAKLESFAKVYRTELLRHIRRQKVDKARMEKEKERLLEFLDDGMKAFDSIIMPLVGAYFLDVQKSLLQGAPQETIEALTVQRAPIVLPSIIREKQRAILGKFLQQTIDRIS